MFKFIKKLLVVFVVLMILGSCANRRNSSKKDPAESFYGTWKASQVKVEDSTISVEELALLGDDSLVECYLVIKEGGSAYLVYPETEDVEDLSWTYNKKNKSITIGNAEFVMDGSYTICSESNGTTIYFDHYSYSENFASLMKKKEEPEVNNTKEEIKEEPKKEEVVEEVKEEPKKEEVKDNNALSKDFLEAMDAYEAFIDEYCTFMKKYSESEPTALMLVDYAKFMADLTSATNKFEKWESSDMTDAETDYYIQVQLRCNQKLTETALSMD